MNMENRRYPIAQTLIGLVFMVAIIWVVFFLFKSIFNVLAWAAPFLFIAALIINYRLVVSYGRMVIGLLKSNPLMGIVAVLLTLFAFPIVAALLFALALMNKKADNFIKKEREIKEGIPTDYTEISSAPRSEYDELFRKK
jgi:hypothetical protein